METRHCVIRGRVQGVGFRWFVVRHARELGVSGTVRNRSDGSVEALLQADTVEPIDALIERLREGPAGGRVATVEVETLAGAKRHSRMTVLE